MKKSLKAFIIDAVLLTMSGQVFDLTHRGLIYHIKYRNFTKLTANSLVK